MNNFLLITNQEWLYYTYVCIKSMKRSKNPDSIYNVYVLCIGFSNDYLIRDLESDDFKIIPIFLDRNILSKENNVGTVYYKLIIQNLIDVDYIFHIDSDCVVVSDLSDVFQYKPKYLGAVPDRLYADYYNMGNVLFNLKNIRGLDYYVPYAFSCDKTDWEIGIYNESHRIHYLFEQDILNYIFNGQIEEIPYGYNVLSNLYTYRDEWIWMEKYHKKLLPSDVNIIHYAGRGEHTKPWNAPDEWHNQKWMDVWRAVEQDKSIDGLVEEACESQWENFRSDSHKY